MYYDIHVLMQQTTIDYRGLHDAFMATSSNILS